MLLLAAGCDLRLDSPSDQWKLRSGSSGVRMKPTLVVNPGDDGVFAAFARVLVDHGTASIAEFERRLKAVYPHAAVHARELAAEPLVIWYVYRDGHWVDSRRVAETSGAQE
jgi:hypothetical protein